MPNVLVTGAAGFIGAHVSRELAAAGHRVVALDDLSGGFRDNLPPEIDFVEGSVLDDDLVRRLFDAHRFEYVFHLAAYAAEGLSHFIRAFNYRNNLIGSVHLINASIRHGVRCFVFTSSIAVYGPTQVPMTEETPPEPEDPYGIAKLAVELDLKAAHRMFGLNSIVFRPHNVYGEYQNIGDRYRNVVGIFMNQIMAGEPMTVFGDGTQTRAFTYIRDIAPVIARSVDLPAAYNQVFNIGADTPYSIVELARAVAAAMGVEPRIRHVEARKEVQHAFSDHAKARAVLGQSAAWSLEAGLAEMARWARQVGARKSRAFDDIEIERGLPPIWTK